MMRQPYQSGATRGPAPIGAIVADHDPGRASPVNRIDTVEPTSAEPTAAESRWADDGGRAPSEAVMSHYPGPLERLYTRHTLIARGRAEGDSTRVHLAIIDRLAANRRIAEGEGWTALALERVGGMGDLRLWGLAPAAKRREVVPDWAPR